MSMSEQALTEAGKLPSELDKLLSLRERHQINKIIRAATVRDARRRAANDSNQPKKEIQP